MLHYSEYFARGETSAYGLHVALRSSLGMARGVILRTAGRRRRRRAARTARGALLAAIAQLLLQLQIFVEANGQILDDHVLYAETALQLGHQLAVRGANLLIDVDAFAVLGHFVSQFAGAPMFGLLDLGALFRAGVLNPADDFLDVLFRSRRASDKNQIVQSFLFHVTSSLSFTSLKTTGREARKILSLAVVAFRIFRRFLAVVLIHRRRKTLLQNHFHGIGSLRHLFRGDFQLRLLHRPQNVSRQVVHRMVRPTAEAQSRKPLRAQAAGYGLGPVVRSGTTAFADANHAPGQIALVKQHQQVRRLQFVLAQQLLHRDAAEIHVRLRLGKKHFFPAELAAPYQRLAFRARNANPMAIGQFVHGHETQIVRRPLILRVRIPKSDDEAHSVFRQCARTARVALLLFLVVLVRAFFGLAAGFRALFAFFVLLALLDDFGLGRGGCRRGDVSGLLFFNAQGHYVGQHAIGFGEQLHLFLVQRQITGTQCTVQRQIAHVRAELRGNVGGQAFDFHFAGNHFKNAAFDLDTLGFAKGVHGNFHAHAHVHGDAQEVHVQKLSGDGVHLPVFQDGRLVLTAEIHLKQSIVSALRTQNCADLLGVYRQGNRFALAAVQRRGQFSGRPQTPCFILAAQIACRAFHYDFFCLSHVLFPSRPKSKSPKLAEPKLCPADTSNKQLANRGFLVNRADPARQQLRHAEHGNLAHFLARFAEGHGIRGYHFLDLRFPDALDRRPRQHGVGTSRKHLCRAFVQ